MDENGSYVQEALLLITNSHRDWKKKVHDKCFHLYATLCKWKAHMYNQPWTKTSKNKLWLILIIEYRYFLAVLTPEGQN